MYKLSFLVLVIVLLCFSQCAFRENQMEPQVLSEDLIGLVFDHEVFNCSKRTFNVVQIRTETLVEYVKASDISLLRDRYEILADSFENFENNVFGIRFSIRSQQPDTVRLYVTCTYPRMEMVTSESILYEFNFVKNEHSWVVDRVVSHN